MATHPCAKRVEPQQAYEVWQSPDGSWTYFVLKKYQSPEKEAKNPHAKWHCMVKSPCTSERGEYGDVYVSTVKSGTHKIENPLAPKKERSSTVMGLPQVMHEAMQSFAPDDANKNTAIAAAVKAGEQFLVDQSETITEKTRQELHASALDVWFLYCNVVTSRLLPEEVRLQLPPLYSQEHEEDPLVVCKFFTPDSFWTWYGMEFDGLDVFFGLVYGLETELGYFSLHELEETRGSRGLPIERDLHFTPMRLSEVKKLHAETPQQPTLTIYVIEFAEGEDDS